jgi:hypothetical protein
VNNVILTQIIKIFESKAKYLLKEHYNLNLGYGTLEGFQRDGILWCIAIINQICQSPNPQTEIDLLKKKFNIK